jgi:hypothetical protein
VTDETKEAAIATSAAVAHKLGRFKYAIAYILYNDV